MFFASVNSLFPPFQKSCLLRAFAAPARVDKALAPLYNAGEGGAFSSRRSEPEKGLIAMIKLTKTLAAALAVLLLAVLLPRPCLRASAEDLFDPIGQTFHNVHAP